MERVGTSRQDAKEHSLKYYVSSTPCRRGGHLTRRSAKSGTCLECQTIRRNLPSTKEWHKNNYLQNIDKRKKQMRENAVRNRATRYTKYLKKTYCLTQEDYVALLKKQGGNCAICEEPITRKKLYVDHCHTHNSVRGLLCVTCNFMLGYAYDNPAILLAGIKYLKAAQGVA